MYKYRAFLPNVGPPLAVHKNKENIAFLCVFYVKKVRNFPKNAAFWAVYKMSLAPKFHILQILWKKIGKTPYFPEKSQKIAENSPEILQKSENFAVKIWQPRSQLHKI